MKTNCSILRRRSLERTTSPVALGILASLLWLATSQRFQAQPILAPNQLPDQSACLGGGLTYKVTATGTNPLSYEWRIYTSSTAFSVVPGETNDTVVLCNLQPSDNRLRVRVTDSNGVSILSPRYAKMTMLEPPRITQQPGDAWAVIGQSFTLSVTATGSPPVYYQWYFNEQLLAGKATSSLLISSVQMSNAGNYYFVVSNVCGTVTSATARLTAVEDTTFTRITNGTVVTDLGNSFVSMGDYDGDGYMDLLVFRYRIGRTSLYRNNRDGTFSSLTNGIFPFPVGEIFFGPCSDFDNDGRLDFYLWSGTNTNFIYYNEGAETFTTVPFEGQYGWSMSVADYDNDGLLDLYVSGFTGVTNRLYRNLGGRTYRAMNSLEVGAILGANTFGGPAWADYDDDGCVDVVVPSQRESRCFLYRNTGGGRFVAVTNQLTSAAIRALAAGWGDYDNDGRVDLCLAVYGGESLVYRNLGGGNFERASIGVTIQSQYNGAAWGDYDNDGFLDLFMTYGNNTGNSLFRNNGNGTFTRITNGPVVLDRPTGGDASYAGLWLDYDNDGFLDLFVPIGNDFGTANTTNLFYHNDGNANAWLKVKLVGTVSNREGAGAKVRAKATFAGASRWLRRDITSGGDPYNGSGPIAHFGLRDATNVETLRVEWPSGQVTELHDLAVRQFLTITEAPGLRAIGMSQGTMQMQLTAHPGMSVGMEVSSNIVDWVPWQTLPQTNRTTPVTDPEAGQHPRRFYKARVQ